MKRAACVLAVAVAALAAGPAAASSQPRCRAPRHTKQITRGSRAVAYLVRTGHGGDYQGRLVGCLLHSGRRVTVKSFLSDDFERETIGMVRVKGHYVAYLWDESDHYGNESLYAISFDLRKREERWRTAISGYSGLPGEGTITEIRAFVLARDGAFAYLAHFRSYPSGEQTVQLLARDRRGHDRLLDSGDGIDAASVRVRRQTLTWTNDGVDHSSNLR